MCSKQSPCAIHLATDAETTLQENLQQLQDEFSKLESTLGELTSQVHNRNEIGSW